MSHTVEAKVKITRATALRAALEHLQLPIVDGERHKLYDGTTAPGVAFQLPAWKYPVVVDTATGTARYDNYGGSWGKDIELDKVVQRYTAECVREEAMLAGYEYSEEQLPNGELLVRAVSMAAT